MLSLTSQPTVRPVQSASRAWFRLAVAAIGVSLISLLTNVTSLEQLSGADQEFAAIRKILTRLTNAGVLWAGVAFLGGWLVRRPAPAIIAGTAGLVIALVTHYGFASLTGLMPWTDLASNYLWFLSALLFGPPLGLIGAYARRTDGWGLLARLIMPAGMIIEPIYFRMLFPVPLDTWSNRVSAQVAGSILIMGGIVFATIVIRNWQAAPRS